MDSTRYWEMRTQAYTYNEQLDPPTNNKYETNREMYLGNQWLNTDVKDLPKPVFNIIKRIITYFVANLTSSAVKVKWDEIVTRDNGIDEEAAEVLTSEFEHFKQEEKFEDKLVELITDAAVVGDMCTRMYFDKESKPYAGKLNENVMGEIKMDVISGNLVHFGNANVRQVQKQPWIQIETRELVKDLKKEAKDNQEDITTDSPSQGFDANSGDIEIEGKGSDKVTVVYTWEKKDGKIIESKSTENVVIYEDVDTGLTLYPIAWGNWQTQKNQYHGKDVVSEVINNQIFINRAFALAMWNVLQVAFPKLIYRNDLVSKPSNAVGTATGVKNLPPGTRLNEVMDFVQPGNMSVQVMQLIDDAMRYTKEVMGISDAALGSVNPEQASGTAIVAVQKQAEIPLGIPQAAIYNFVGDIADIFCEMSSVYYGKRPVVVDGENGKELKMFDFDMLQDALIKSNVDVGASTYWSELAQTQTIENLYAQDKVTAVEFFERLPDNYVMDRTGLLKAREQEEQQAKVGEFEQYAQVLESLPPEEQERILALPEEEQRAVLDGIMNQVQLAQ